MERQYRIPSPLTAALALAALITANGGAMAGVSANDALQPDAATLAAMQRTDRIIIKYRGETAESAAPNARELQQLGAEIGTDIFFQRRNTFGARLIKLRSLAPLDEVAQMVERIRRLPGVEYAEPDLRLQPLLTPNDSRYNEQWHYFEATGGLNLPSAWDQTQGAGAVVAVVDTGYLPHADLAANLLPGYDMIDDPFVGNDGDGRDADATDPGDWSNTGDCGAGVPGSNSSWHGTHVAGTVAAVTNNSSGVAGVAYAAKVVPVRVLGRCGGYTSDIADGIVWAAGGSVTGVPSNANPADVINLSLGGSGSCGTTTQNAIDTARSLGATVVVAAGNSNIDAVNANPANCAGVVTVAATNRNGGRAYYSNFGAVVDVAAPGGDVTTGSANGVLSTLNSGTSTAAADSYAFYQGTSMAAPHVAGVAALLYAADPAITPDLVESTLTSTARAFPATCTSCGSGIVDASAAVTAVLGGTPPPDGGGSGVLANGVAETNLAAATGEELHYTLDVPAGATNLEFNISGGTGDADLYVNFGSAPTTTTYECRPYLSGNNETCTISNVQAGTYYVMVRAYTSYSGVSLTGSYTEPGSGGGLPASFENTANVTIRDFRTATSTASVSGVSGAVTVDVEVDIIHTYIGDLRIDIVAPNGATARLKDTSNDSSDNLHTVYSVGVSGLAEQNGTWSLKVYDAYQGDTGYIDRFGLTFR